MQAAHQLLSVEAGHARGPACGVPHLLGGAGGLLVHGDGVQAQLLHLCCLVLHGRGLSGL